MNKKFAPFFRSYETGQSGYGLVNIENLTQDGIYIEGHKGSGPCAEEIYPTITALVIEIKEKAEKYGAQDFTFVFNHKENLIVRFVEENSDDTSYTVIADDALVAYERPLSIEEKSEFVRAFTSVCVMAQIQKS